ncbi:MAG: glycosyltransferase family 39 protein, partial [Phycisphaerae bacterium]|nr:glycosyltransferase family 39 protein [Phycisphaerae bacterium]
LIICAVLLLSVVIAFWTLSESPLNDHECFVSVAAREMLESGDWIMPTCNGELRLQKTPLSYWLVAGFSKITGQVDEFTTRLPSALFGILSVAAILYFVNQWLSFRIAVLSAAVWATSLSYILYSHNGRPEMVVTFFIMLCLLSFYSAVLAKKRKKQIIYLLVFWISFAMANLAKGPVPLPLVLMPLFFYVAVFRQWKQVPKFLPIIGTIIFLAVVLPWPLAIASRLNWDLAVWKREFVDRFFGTYASDGKPLYYYLPKMFQFMSPWAAFVPFALAAPFYRVWNKKQPAMLFLWLWFIVDLAFLSLSSGKRQHYILPAMPAMTILTAILLEDMAFSQKAFTKKLVRNLLLLHLAILAICFIALPIIMSQLKHEFLAEAIITSAAGLIVIIVVALMFRAGKVPSGCAAIFAGIAVLTMIGYTFLANPLNYNQPSRQFSRAVARKVPPSDNLIAYKSASTRFIHYSGRRVPEIQSKSEVYELYKQGAWVVAFGKYLDELLEGNSFDIVYLQENAERHKEKVVGGALMHTPGGDNEDKI